MGGSQSIEEAMKEESFTAEERANMLESALERLIQRELSGAVRKLKTAPLRHPVVPVADGFVGGFVRVCGVELRKRNGHLPPLPTDLHEHVVLARVLNSHA